MKYLEDSRLTQLTSDLTGASLNTRGRRAPPAASGRVLHGRVEAYTTKRTGADKKAANQVGLQYANQMELFNAAVEKCQKKRERPEVIDLTEEVDAGEERAAALLARERKIERRRRSCSVDGVTFATDINITTATTTATTATTTPLMPLEEGTAVTLGGEVASSIRNLPLEGILKRPCPPSNKRCRATSFDVSTGPSFEGSGPSVSSRGKPTNKWGNVGKVTTGEGDRHTHPLIPQPSLYQSSTHDARDRKPATTMVPRRLVTDLILTLNASFPDYDFSAAQVSDFCTLSTAEAARRIDARLGDFARTTDRGCGFLPRLWGSLEDVVTGGLEGCEVYSYAPRVGSGEEEDPLEFLTRSLAAAAPWEEGDGDAGAAPAADGTGGGKATGKREERFVFSPTRGGRIVSRNIAARGDSGLAASLAYALPEPPTPAPSSAAPHVTLWSMNYFFVSRNKKRIVLFACVQTMRTPRGRGEDDDDDGDDDDYGENAPVFDEARRGDMRIRQEEAATAAGGGGDAAYLEATRGVSASSTVTRMASGDESVLSVRVGDTDVEEGADMGDADGEEGYYGGNDFDTGSLSVPSWVA